MYVFCQILLQWEYNEYKLINNIFNNLYDILMSKTFLLVTASPHEDSHSSAW